MADNVLRDITQLASLGGLVTLNLSGNEIMDLTPLTALPGLRTLYLDNNPIRDLSPLYGMSNLKSLSIKGIDITESQLSELSRALPSCAIHSEQAQEEKQDITFGGVLPGMTADKFWEIIATESEDDDDDDWGDYTYNDEWDY
jgi:Leucine-rich repeat (LRR) protein